MRLPLLLILAVCLLVAPETRAQEVPLPKPDTQDPAPEAAATPAPTPELIPADILPPPDPAALPGTLDIPTIEQLDEGLKPPPLSHAAEAHRLHLEWRKLRNQVQNDPRVKAALAESEAARTDLQRRKLLARYIELFHARMIAIAPKEMKQYLLDRKREQLAALPQPNVRPETALPTATRVPVAAATGSPGASPTPTVPVSNYGSPTPTPGRSGLLGLPRP